MTGARLENLEEEDPRIVSNRCQIRRTGEENEFPNGRREMASGVPSGRTSSLNPVTNVTKEGLEDQCELEKTVVLFETSPGKKINARYPPFRGF